MLLPMLLMQANCILLRNSQSHSNTSCGPCLQVAELKAQACSTLSHQLTSASWLAVTALPEPTAD